VAVKVGEAKGFIYGGPGDQETKQERSLGDVGEERLGGLRNRDGVGGGGAEEAGQGVLSGERASGGWVNMYFESSVIRLLFHGHAPGHDVRFAAQRGRTMALLVPLEAYPNPATFVE
jgi:hypothetical protein